MITLTLLVFIPCVYGLIPNIRFQLVVTARIKRNKMIFSDNNRENIAQLFDNTKWAKAIYPYQHHNDKKIIRKNA